LAEGDVVANLERKQALSKLTADLLHMVSQFDDLKVSFNFFFPFAFGFKSRLGLLFFVSRIFFELRLNFLFFFSVDV